MNQEGHSGNWQDPGQPPGAGTMNVVRGILLGLLAVLAVVSVASYVATRRPRTAAESAARAAYYCPMHPSYTSDRPGECPICGMDLEPIPEGQTTASGHASNVRGLSAVHIAPDRARLIGVRTAVVERRALASELDLVGFVAPDESWMTTVQLRVAGWVEFLHVSRTGDRIEERDPLLSLYSPELYQAEQEFLIEIGAHADSVQHETHGTSGLDTARERLLLLGISHEELVRLERDRVASARIVIRSPVRGTVLERGVTQGQYVAADTRLFVVADLSRIWVLADLYEGDQARVGAGDLARFTTDALPGRVFESRVEFVYPTVSSETRTIKVRLALANPGRVLKPGIFGRVRVRGRQTRGLAVPSEAVVRAGDQSYVFLAHAGGHFEPRVVELGLQETDWLQVMRGLAEGDTVVSSASFLIDSESRLKAAIAGMGSQPHGDHGK